MKTGYILPFSNSYKLLWLWAVIIFAFQKTVYHELNDRMNLILTILEFLAIAVFLILIFPHRYVISEGKLYYSVFSRVKMKEIDLARVTAVKSSRFRFEFSFAGKRYQFLTFGKSRKMLEDMFYPDRKNA